MEDSRTMSDTLLIITNFPDADSARRLATHAVEFRLAACVNILAPCRSVYRWEGRVEDGEEHPLLIKTTAQRYAALERAILEHHPFEVPEIIALPVSTGLPAYLGWVASETRPDSAH